MKDKNHLFQKAYYKKIKDVIISFSGHPVLIDRPKYRQSILGFVINVLLQYQQASCSNNIII